MTMQLHHTVRTPSAYTAASAAAGYPASNAGNLRVLKPWRSTGLASQWLQVDLGSSVAVAAIAFSDCNFATAIIFADNAATPVTNRGPASIGTDRGNRLKGSRQFAATVRYLRITISGGTSDGLAYFRCGSVLVFTQSQALPRDSLYGGTNVDVVFPQARVDLPNGAMEVNSTGPSYCEIGMSFAARASDDVEVLARRARADVCWLDLGLTDQGQQWPIRHGDPRISRRLEKFNRETVPMLVREIA